MNALQVMNRYWKEVIQASTWKNDIKVQYLYNTCTESHNSKKWQFKTGLIFLTSRSDKALHFWNFFCFSSSQLLLVVLLVLERVSLLRFQIGILDPPKGVERPELDKKKKNILVSNGQFYRQKLFSNWSNSSKHKLLFQYRGEYIDRVPYFH